jgi:hypothetical protein
VYLLVLLCTSLYFGVHLCTQPAKDLDSASKKQSETQRKRNGTQGRFGTQGDATRRAETQGDDRRRIETKPAERSSLDSEEQPKRQRTKNSLKNKNRGPRLIFPFFHFFSHFLADSCKCLQIETQPANESNSKPKKQLETT